jgi:hypothetical protein
MFEENRNSMIRIRPLKKKEKEGGERRLHLKCKVSMLGGPWKVPLLSGP